MRNPRSSNTLWTDAELADAVETYVFLLKAQSVSLPFRSEAAAQALLEEGLPGRNDASLRYRFRNISAVVRDLNGPLLAGYSPAEQVGAGVRQRIRALLDANPDFQKILVRTRVQDGGDHPLRLGGRQEALEALARLRQSLDDVEREILGIGHNNPPEPLMAGGQRRGAFDDVRRDIVALESQMGAPAPDHAAVSAHSLGLVQFGVKIAAWLGQRTTKFTDVALATLAPALVIKLTGLLPVLVEALGAVARAVGH
jgi:hypothetical protein